MTPDEQMILKVEIEKILCGAMSFANDAEEGYERIATLMCIKPHDLCKSVSRILNQLDLDYDLHRPENWTAFSDAVSHARIEDGKYTKKELSPKTARLRDASYMLALLADCFEYVEKAELNKTT